MSEETSQGAPRRRRRGRIRAVHPPANRPPEVKNEINVTPLVDVVLVLLIIFMVVTPMLSRGIAVDLPLTRHHEKRNDTGGQVVVSVSREGRIFIDADPVSEEELPERLRRELDAKAKGGERLIHVKGDRSLQYGAVRKVLERIHAAGTGQVALGTEELKKAEGEGGN